MSKEIARFHPNKLIFFKTNNSTQYFKVLNYYRIMFNKPEFIGKEAILKIKEEGVTKRLAQFHLMNFDKVIEYHSNILISRNLFLSINFADFTNFF